MTSASNSTAQPLGFTTYGRPILDATIELSFDDLPSMMAAIMPPIMPPIERPDAAPIENVDDAHCLVGEDNSVIATNLKTFAFAKSRALHWSRALGEVVSICAIDENDGALWVEQSVAAHRMSAEEFASATLEAERARLENVIASLGEIAMSVRAAREDAREALDALDAAAAIDEAPVAAIADTMRGFVETFEALAWYVLIDESDADMLGELSATS